MKKEVLFVLMVFLILPVSVFSAFTIEGDTSTLQRAPAVSDNLSLATAVLGVVLAVFLVYWFVFRKKK